MTPAALLRRLTALFASRDSTPPDPEEVRVRRAFMQDMITRNPGAFSCDLDVQAMMQTCSRYL